MQLCRFSKGHSQHLIRKPFLSYIYILSGTHFLCTGKPPFLSYLRLCDCCSKLGIQTQDTWITPRWENKTVTPESRKQEIIHDLQHVAICECLNKAQGDTETIQTKGNEGSGSRWETQLQTTNQTRWESKTRRKTQSTLTKIKRERRDWRRLTWHN